MAPKYDIFISYRRKGGYVTAKHLYDLLTRDGYNVSFDIDTLRNGDFDIELLKRIDECTDFILILNKEVFDRTLNGSVDIKQDWLRNELAYALKKGKNIIPIMLEGFTEYPDNLPADIARVQMKNGPKYDQYYFDDFYRRLKDIFLDTPPPKESQARHDIWTLKLTTDIDCHIFVDGTAKYEATGGCMTLIQLEEGTYRIDAVSKQDNSIKATRDYTINNSDILDTISLQEIILKRNEDLAQNNLVKVITGLLNEYDGPLSWNTGCLGQPLPKAYEAGFLICKNGQYGVADITGKTIIPPKFKRISYSNEMYRADLHKLFNKQGKLVFEVGGCDGDNIGITSQNGLTPVIENNKCKYIDKSGNTILQGDWKRGTPFINGIAAVEEIAGWNFINEQGQVIVSQCYESIYFSDSTQWLNEGLIGVKINGKSGFVDTSGKVITPIKFNDINTPFINGYAVVEKAGRFRDCFIDRNGKISGSVNAEDYYCGRIGELLPVIHNVNTLGFAAPDGTMAIPSEYECDIKCKYVISPSMSENLILVKKNGKYGFIDFNNKVIIDFIYDKAAVFYGNYAYVEIGHKVGFIDKTGKFTAVRERKQETKENQPSEDALKIHGVFCPGYRYATDSQNRLGVVNDKGKIVIPCMYRHALPENYGYRGSFHKIDYHYLDYYFDVDYVIKHNEIAMPVCSDYSNPVRIDIWDLKSGKRLRKKDSKLLRSMRWKNFRVLVICLIFLGLVYTSLISNMNLFSNWANLTGLYRILLVIMGAIGTIGTVSLFAYDFSNWNTFKKLGMISTPILTATAFLIYVLIWGLPELHGWLNVIRIIGYIVCILFLAIILFTGHPTIYSKVSK